MPSDEFQQLVYLIQRQFKTRRDAVVSESKRLTNRNTGKRREVDVVVEFTESGVPSYWQSKANLWTYDVRLP